jgi:[acyl-carrier-protein] S-malonyltransferase
VAYTLYGREPVIAAGHSLGEYSALVAAGAIRFEDALRLVHKRGRYMQEAVPVGLGAMAAVLGASYEDLNRALAQVTSGVVQIANWNSPEQIVIAGHKAAVEEALAIAKPPRSVMLPVSAPFHSSLMIGAEERLAVDLDATEFLDLKFPIVTNVDARIIRTGAEARSALKRQVSRPVLWNKAMELFAGESLDAFVELGAGKVLTGLIKRIGRGWPKPFAMGNVEDMESLARTRASIA